MKTIRIDASRSYDVVIGPDLLAEAGRRIAALTGRVRAMVVSDSRVFPLYGKSFWTASGPRAWNRPGSSFLRGSRRRTSPPTGACWRSFAAFALPAAT